MWIKICGARDVASARAVVDAGADALGLNFVARSKRRVTVDEARVIGDAVRGLVELVGVVEDCPLEQACEIRQLLGLDRIQIHVTRSSLDESMLPDWAYIAVGLAEPADAERLVLPVASPVLVDGCVAGKSGGTGVALNWSWVKPLAQRRKVILAGGLTPNNIGAAISAVAPFGVDVASGVEVPGNPGLKDPDLVVRFVTEARAAARRLESTLTQ